MENNEKKDEKNIENHTKEIDTSRFLIKQKLKLDTTRVYTPIVTITERERRQFNQGGSQPSQNAILLEKAHNAIKVAENHIKEEALKQEKNVVKKSAKSIKTSIVPAEAIKDGNFEFGFDALTGSSGELEDKV